MNKKVFSLLFTFIVSILLFTNVHALSVVEVGETVEHTGKYDSTKFVAGYRVTNKAEVDGAAFVAGNEVSLEGKSSYGFYAGNIVDVNETVEKDVFIAGNSVRINNDSNIGRDAYIAGSTITIHANIGRNVRVAGNSVDISNAIINGDAYIYAEEIIMNEETTITGMLHYVEDANVVGLDKAQINDTKTIKTDDVTIDYNFGNVIWAFIEIVIAAVIVMLVLFYFIPKSKERLDELEFSFGNVCKNILIGLGVLVILPIISFVALLTGVLTPLALIFIGLYILGLYLSCLLVSYIIGSKISINLFHNNSVYLELIIGILLFKLVVLIPYLGGLVMILSLFYGLGLIFNFIKNR